MKGPSSLRTLECGGKEIGNTRGRIQLTEGDPDNGMTELQRDSRRWWNGRRVVHSQASNYISKGLRAPRDGRGNDYLVDAVRQGAFYALGPSCIPYTIDEICLLVIR
jgi:hypothetical protein